MSSVTQNQAAVHTPAATAYLKHGVPSTLVSSMMHKFFSYPPEYLDTLSRYYLIYWSPEYFFEQMQNGLLIHQDKEYVVVYHKCTPTKLKNARQVALSFRIAQKEYQNLKPIVLVQGKF